VETDAKLQKTIQTEFSASTLLCIAHRLNTIGTDLLYMVFVPFLTLSLIAYYDRILVMDAGRVAEFDTPLNLFDKEDSIFRSLCNEASLSRQDIVRIRANIASLPRSFSS
jgi:ABC-type multidrug transport system fused ATPase/permease subunit